MRHSCRLAIVALLVSACGAPAPRSASVPTALDEPSVSIEPAAVQCPGWINAQGLDPTTPEQLQNALRFRREMGLASGIDVVRQMACRKDANVDFGVPLTAAELAEFERRTREGHAIQNIVQPYADQHGDEFGGLYIDQSRGGVVTVLWTAHLPQHEAAIRSKVNPDAAVAFRQVRWSERVLRALQDRISSDWDWFRNIPASPQSVGVDVFTNAVVVEISSANPGAAALIVAHYGMADGMIRVESDGTGAALLPSGTVRGLVVRRDGQPLGDSGSLSLQERPGGPPGSCGGGDIGFGVGEDGQFEYPCTVGVRIIQVAELRNTPPNRVLGEARVEIAAGAVVFVQIQIDPPGQP
jgi:hypothetical protein